MLRAAVDVICERGFSETRISDVAARADASPALVIYYFGTKDGLLTEALRWSEDQFYCGDRAGARPAGLGPQAAGDAGRRSPACARATRTVPESWGLWFDLWVQAFRHPGVAKDRAEMDQRWRGVIAGIVRDGQASGEFGEVDIEDFAITWGALLDGLSIQVALEDPAVDSESGGGDRDAAGRRAARLRLGHGLGRPGARTGGAAPLVAGSTRFRPS